LLKPEKWLLLDAFNRAAAPFFEECAGLSPDKRSCPFVFNRSGDDALNQRIIRSNMKKVELRGLL
jgi:hypothetical protein